MKDKIVAVTGANGSLGHAVAARFTAAGAKVAAIDITDAIDLPEASLSIPAVDSADPAAAADAISLICSRLGSLDALVNVAGGFGWQTTLDGDAETWDLLHRLNLRTAFVMSQAALPALAETHGAIVNISAAAAMRATAGMGAYSASKAGVCRLTEALAEELKAQGVRVNAVLPSIIDTPANRADMPTADFTRWVRADEVAEAIHFLCSEAASGVTGALLPVTGRV